MKVLECVCLGEMCNEKWIFLRVKVFEFVFWGKCAMKSRDQCEEFKVAECVCVGVKCVTKNEMLEEKWRF